MNVSDYMGTEGTWFKPADLTENEVTKIEGVEAGTDFNGNPCLNITISGDRKITLKKKHVGQIAKILGNDASEWIDKEIGLEMGETEYNGEKFPAFVFVPADDLPF